MKNHKLNLLLLLCILIFVFVGCSSKESIVGTWQESDNPKRTITFYDDGSCLNIPYHAVTSADVVSYSLHDDGNLILKMEWDGPITVKKTDDENEALERSSYYYLSKDKLILKRTTFERQN